MNITSPSLIPSRSNITTTEKSKYDNSTNWSNFSVSKKPYSTIETSLKPNAIIEDQREGKDIKTRKSEIKKRISKINNKSKGNKRAKGGMGNGKVRLSNSNNKNSVPLSALRPTNSPITFTPPHISERSLNFTQLSTLLLNASQGLSTMASGGMLNNTPNSDVNGVGTLSLFNSNITDSSFTNLSLVQSDSAGYFENTNSTGTSLPDNKVTDMVTDPIQTSIPVRETTGQLSIKTHLMEILTTWYQSLLNITNTRMLNEHTQIESYTEPVKTTGATTDDMTAKQGIEDSSSATVMQRSHYVATHAADKPEPIQGGHEKLVVSRLNDLEIGVRNLVNKEDDVNDVPSRIKRDTWSVDKDKSIKTPPKISAPNPPTPDTPSSIPSLTFYRPQRTNTENKQELLNFLKDYAEIAKQIPDPMKVASESVKKALTSAGINGINPDTVYYHRFTNEHHSWGGVRRHNGPPAHSYTLTQAAMARVYDEFYDDPDMVWDEVGIYNVGYKNAQERPEWNGQDLSSLTGEKFINAMNGIDIQSDYTQALNQFWQRNGDSYKNFLKKIYEYSANAQRKSGDLTEAQYQLATKLIKSRDSVNCYLLDVYTYATKDILLIEAPNSSGGLCYLPGAKPPFIPYNDRNELRDKIKHRIENPANRNALAGHISLYNRQDGVTYSGADSALNGIATGRWDKSYIAEKIQPMPEDVFGAIKDNTAAMQRSDGDTVIKSNSEARRDYFLEVANSFMVYLPVLDSVAPEVMVPLGVGLISGQFGSSMDQAVNGDTLDERMAGTVGSSINGAMLGASLLIPGIAKSAISLKGICQEAETTLTEGKQAVLSEGGPITQRVSVEIIEGLTETPIQVIHPETEQILYGVKLTNTQEKALLYPLGDGRYVKVDPVTGYRVGNKLVHKVMSPTTGSIQWLEDAGLKGGMMPSGKVITTWGAGESEINSIVTSRTASGAKDEILFMDEITNLDNASGYEDRVDPFSSIPNMKTLHENSRAAILEAQEHPFRKGYNPNLVGSIAFRGDERLPDEIFHSGFIRRPENVDFFSITGDQIGISGVVSTTTDEEIAINSAKNQKNGGYVYGIKLSEGGVSVNTESVDGRSLCEVGVLNVPPKDILFAIGPYDVLNTDLTETVQGLPSVELRINPHAVATIEEAQLVFNKIKSRLTYPLESQMSFAERFESRADLFFNEDETHIPDGDGLKGRAGDEEAIAGPSNQGGTSARKIKSEAQKELAKVQAKQRNIQRKIEQLKTSLGEYELQITKNQVEADAAQRVGMSDEVQRLQEQREPLEAERGKLLRKIREKSAELEQVKEKVGQAKEIVDAEKVKDTGAQKTRKSSASNRKAPESPSVVLARKAVSAAQKALSKAKNNLAKSEAEESGALVFMQSLRNSPEGAFMLDNARASYEEAVAAVARYKAEVTAGKNRLETAQRNLESELQGRPLRGDF